MAETVRTEEFSMDYIKFGEGSKNLVIIPGLSVKPVTPMGMMIESAYSVFKEDYTVYLFDRRNNAPDNYTDEDMAEDTYQALVKLGINKAHFIGASQGGAIILKLAIMHPDMPESLSVCSSSPYVNDMSKEVLGTWLDFANKRDAVGLATSMIDSIFSKGTLDGTREVLIKNFSDLSEEEFVQFINMSANFYGYDVREELHNIKCPTFVVGCEGDRVFGPEASRQIYEGISKGNDKCELYIYDGSYGHAVYDEAPDFKDRLYIFMKKY